MNMPSVRGSSASPAPRTLQELIVAMREGVYHEDEWAELPTFGGVHCGDSSDVWSWDQNSVLVGTYAADLVIVLRRDWFGESDDSVPDGFETLTDFNATLGEEVSR